MHIALVAFVEPGSESGENAFTLGLVEALATQPGVRVSLVCPEPLGLLPMRLQRSNVQPYYLSKKKRSSLRWSLGVQPAIWKALNRAVGEWGPLDGLVSTLRPAALAPAAYSLLKALPEVLVVESLASSDVRKLHGRWPAAALAMDVVTWLNSLRSKRVMVAFEAVRDWIGSLPLVRAEKVERFHHGVDIDRYRLLDVGEARVAAGLPLSPDDFVVGFAGSFKWYHTVPLLLRAVAMSVDADGRVLLVGDGPTLGDCRRLVVELGLQDRVHFTGNVLTEAVPVLLSACDVLYGVIDPRHWGHAMKVYEYMSAARPFVYLVGRDTSFMNEQGIGWAISEPSEAAVATALLELRRLSSAQRLALGTIGRSFAARNCRWDTIADRIVDALRVDR